MKYLSDYMEEKQTALFNETGTFFAFSDKQFKEQHTKGIKYVSLGSGMITPKENANKVIETLHKIHKKAMKEDLKDNGIQGVIQRELENYEVYYTNDLEPAMEALKDYPEITQKDIIKVYQRK
tara:strand:+ start:275 stop:643 length:369 start_codon:yes stop_codon:yes gene_type:complete